MVMYAHTRLMENFLLWDTSDVIPEIKPIMMIWVISGWCNIYSGWLTVLIRIIEIILHLVHS